MDVSGFAFNTSLTILSIYSNGSVFINVGNTVLSFEVVVFSNSMYNSDAINSLKDVCLFFRYY